MRANGISNPRRLRSGMKLKIPSSGGARTAVKTQHYVVKKGDHLSKIAKRFNTSLSVLRQLNPGLGRVIYPGQKLRVK